MLRESAHCHSGNTDCNFLGYVAVFCLSALIMEVADSPERSVNIYKLLTYPSNGLGSSETSVNIRKLLAYPSNAVGSPETSVNI